MRGRFRESDALVLGAKFETIDHKAIIPEMIKMDAKVKSVYEKRTEDSISLYIKAVVRLHHELTIIHPFGDGNGRTLRAFFNVMMTRNGLTPIFVRVEDKEEYLAALAVVDKSGNYAPLYEFFFRAVLRTNVDLTR